jgi:hypothetical protein
MVCGVGGVEAAAGRRQANFRTVRQAYISGPEIRGRQTDRPTASPPATIDVKTNNDVYFLIRGRGRCKNMSVLLSMASFYQSKKTALTS